MHKTFVLRILICALLSADSGYAQTGEMTDTNLRVTKPMLTYNFQAKTIKVALAGVWQKPNRQNEIVTNLVGAFDFTCVPNAVWEKLADKARVASQWNTPVDWSDSTVRLGLVELLYSKPRKGAESMEGFLKQVAQSFSSYDVKPAEALPTSLLLSSIQFRFDTLYNSFWHSGDLGMLGIHGRPINMTTLDSKIEYANGRLRPDGVQSHDSLRIYLEWDYENWVFIEFYDDVVRMLAGDDDVNAMLAKSDKHKGYRYELANEDAKDAFLLKFVSNYIWRTNR